MKKPDDALIDGWIRGVQQLCKNAGRGQAGMDPPPPVLDRPLGLHQVLERVVRKRERDTEVTLPAVEENEEKNEGDEGLENVGNPGTI